jgi:hypothetical protein
MRLLAPCALAAALAACARTGNDADGGAPSRAPLGAASASASAGAHPSALDGGSKLATTPPRARCTVEAPPESIDDRGGKAGELGTTKLENLRVLASGDTTVATWERESDFTVGDSWRAPVIAMRHGASPFVIRELPVRAYACATYGHVGIASLDAPFVTWGVNNTNAFESYGTVPELAGPAGMDTVKTPPKSRLVTRRQEVRDFVASRGVVLATTFDASCDTLCTCADTAHRGLWLYSLDSPKTKPTRLASLPSREGSPLVPALAMSDTVGVAAYRIAGVSHLVWLDGTGIPTGAPLRIDEGDVGAPALAIAGKRVIVTWARRGAKTEPYELRWLAVEHGATTLPAAKVLPTAGSAFAPGALTDGADAVLTWMEGDGGTRGAVFAARVALDESRPASPSVVVSMTDETNARDPEVSGTVDAPVIAYAAFDAKRPGGVARVARLACVTR